MIYIFIFIAVLNLLFFYLTSFKYEKDFNGLINNVAIDYYEAVLQLKDKHMKLYAFVLIVANILSVFVLIADMPFYFIAFTLLTIALSYNRNTKFLKVTKLKI